VDTRVDPVSRSVTVRANIPNPDRALKPGMLLTVEMIRKETETLMVPEEAIFMEKERKFVWVVDAENGVVRREIATDRRRPGDVEVLSGLEIGDRVIVQGVNRVREGSSVDVMEVESPAGA
ncbi:MAG: efflux RND transporter periplasmic adaptor subunit, partial [Thermodesulfobacteriota bacterium]